jgi:hypothetical protein
VTATTARTEVQLQTTISLSSFTEEECDVMSLDEYEVRDRRHGRIIWDETSPVARVAGFVGYPLPQEREL